MDGKWHLQALRINDSGNYDVMITSGLRTMEPNRKINNVKKNVIDTIIRYDDVEYLLKNPKNGGERFRPLMDWELKEILKHSDN